ncbi:hypothetical protein CSKR_107784 [Clonorchis sinensis]|uniref:Probable RNA polymerase II nuclear localization protein SLC7A6OS n=1 Tax=Clonorchis sinensis TaxID=79923 RepID=A0A3R7FG74_CLOSI|nr:hypothetical protein CSKR_107784 [Clonorchis sinensis]
MQDTSLLCFHIHLVCMTLLSTSTPWTKHYFSSTYTCFTLIFHFSMTVYLRVKRPRNETAVVSAFETEPIKKLCRLDSDPVSPTVFRYVGSQKPGDEISYDTLSSLNRVNTRGTGKLILNTNSGTILSCDGTRDVDCEVKINTLKRSTSTSLTSKDCAGPPAKVLKIIDIIPESTQLDTLLRELQVGTSPVSKRLPEESEIDYVYDLYLLERRTRQRRSRSASSSSSRSHSSRYAENEIVFDDIYGQDDDVHDDEDDSNSESNWRNDYPDEEDTTDDDDDSSSSSSADRKSNADSDDAYIYSY